MKRIYLSPPDLDGREKELLIEAVDSNWITTLGPQVNAFEEEICKKVGVAYGAAVSSGTAALHLALLLLGVRRDDVVLCSDLTFAATVNVITYCGAIPVFIDSNWQTWNMDPDLLAEEMARLANVGRLPKAVITVDLYGQCADYKRILDICKEYGVPLVEDAAEALGATYGDSMAGSFGEMGVISFNGNKVITTSGGGMLVSQNKKYIERAKYLSSQARDPAPYYQHSHVGYNYRLSNLLAAVGRAQLETLDRKLVRRREINVHYRNELADLPGVEFMPEAQYGRSNCWLTCISVDPDKFGASPENIRLSLETQNIESRLLWKPMHLQPVFRGCRVVGGSVGEYLFARSLCLPSGSSLTASDLGRVVRAIRAVHSKTKTSRLKIAAIAS